MTQASQSGGGRSTGNVNKNTDQLGGLADKATDQARTLPNTSKGSPTTLPNKAARQRNESKRSPAM
jgi:tRNA U34 5-carboxymethylaminomethyl modifying enzyme MnmG/GidA